MKPRASLGAALPVPRDPDQPVCSCGAAASATHPGRCEVGHLLKGNTAAVKIGAKSAAFWRAHEDQRREIAESIVRDVGSTLEDAPRALLLAADSIAQATLIRDSAFLYLVGSGGPLSPGGRVRRAFGAWVAATDRLEKHIRLVGITRHAKPAPSVEDFVAQAARAREEER